MFIVQEVNHSYLWSYTMQMTRVIVFSAISDESWKMIFEEIKLNLHRKFCVLILWNGDLLYTILICHIGFRHSALYCMRSAFLKILILVFTLTKN